MHCGWRLSLRVHTHTCTCHTPHMHLLRSHPQGDLPGAAGDSRGTVSNMDRAEYIRKQQSWLLFLRHCAKCEAPPGQCQFGDNCGTAKELWRHIIDCRDMECNYPRCRSSRDLLRHHSKCDHPECPICVPVKMHVEKQKMAEAARQAGAGGAPGVAQGRGLPGKAGRGGVAIGEPLPPLPALEAGRGVALAQGPALLPALGAAALGDGRKRAGEQIKREDPVKKLKELMSTSVRPALQYRGLASKQQPWAAGERHMARCPNAPSLSPTPPSP